ncbi:MAG: cell division protein SepF [Thermoanaerobacteraceae bacterium]|nr:cell division protein SepF [Thermoanaerobacteraceae bacterium]
MNNILKNLMDFLGFDDQNTEDDTEEYYKDEQIPQSITHNDKVVNLHKYSRSKIVVASIHEFDDVIKVCDNLKQKKVLLVNLEKLSHEESRRVLDFISGACYALDGNIQKIDTNIFVLCPDNIEITGDFEPEEKIK